MLADHRRQLEPVELRHADVHQDDGNLLLEQLLERLPRRRRLDQILSQAFENRLVAEQLGGLIIDQQDIDLVVHRHFLRP